MPRARTPAGGEQPAAEQQLPDASDGTPAGAEENAAAAENEQEEPIGVPAEDALGPDERDRVPFAGLLAHEPELRTALLTHEEWQKKLQAYLFPGPPSDEELGAEADDDATEETHA